MGMEMPESTMATGLSDEVRAHVLEQVIEPARRRGERAVTVRAGDVHREMGLSNRVAAVCAALDARKFRESADLELVGRTGPKQGASAVWTFGLSPAGDRPPALVASDPGPGRRVGPLTAVLIAASLAGLWTWSRLRRDD